MSTTSCVCRRATSNLQSNSHISKHSVDNLTIILLYVHEAYYNWVKRVFVHTMLCCGYHCWAVVFVYLCVCMCACVCACVCVCMCVRMCVHVLMDTCTLLGIEVLSTEMDGRSFTFNIYGGQIIMYHTFLFPAFGHCNISHFSSPKLEHMYMYLKIVVVKITHALSK